MVEGIKILSLAYVFVFSEIISESQLYRRKEQNLKRKKRIEQQRFDLTGHQTSATFVSNVENCVYMSEAILGPGDFWAQQ